MRANVPTRRCEVEITGIARCNVKTMWMKGESFGLFEAVIELFGDEAEQDKETQGTEAKKPRGAGDAAAEASGRGAFCYIRSCLFPPSVYFRPILQRVGAL